MSDYKYAIRRRNATIVFILLLLLALARPTIQTSSPNSWRSSSDAISKNNQKPKISLSVPATKKDQKLTGIDVSHYQGKINWSSVLNAHIDFVFIKATEGVGYIDPMHAENSSQLETTKTPYGSYHFFLPKDDALTQAKHFLATTGLKHRLPPVLDIEITQSVDPKDIRKGAKTWLETVKNKTGCTPIIYTNRYFWNDNLNSDFNIYPLWIADYSNRLTLPNHISRWLFWQNSQSGRVEGIYGAVDKDEYQGTLSDLHELSCGV